MKKGIVYSILIYIVLVTLAVYGYLFLAQGKYSILFWLLILILIGVGGFMMPRVSQKYSKEYNEANKIAFSQRSSYQSYLLALLVIVSLLISLYVFIVK